MKKLVLIMMLLAGFGLSKGIAQTYYCNADFETGAIPTGWTQTTLATDGGWKFGNTTFNQYIDPRPHTKYAMTDDWTCNCNKSSDRLITASMNIPAAVTVYMSFDYYWSGYYNTGTETFGVYYSYDGGTTWTLFPNQPAAVGGWTTVYYDVSAQMANHTSVMVSFLYSDGQDHLVGAALDNVKIYTPANFDAVLTSLTPVANTPSSFVLAPGNLTLGGTIFNAGSSAITSLNFKYSDGTATTSNPLTVNIAPLTSYTIPGTITPYHLAAATWYNLKAWVDVVGDGNHTNDTLSTSVTGATFTPTHKVTFEEGTGTWCGWCVRGIVYMDSMRIVHPTTTELIAVHNGDPMTYATYDAGVGGLIGGYPTILIDRKESDDPSAIFDQYTKHIGDFGVADLAVTATYTPNTGNITVHSSAHFASPIGSGHGVYRLGLVITEDQVHSTVTGGTWDQHNYYSGQANSGSYALPTGGGHNFHTEANPIPATLMYYDFVGRYIGGTFTGTVGSLPTTIAANATQIFDWTYHIPTGYNPLHMKAIVLLINSTTGQVVNANSAVFPTVGIDEVGSIASNFNIYPNPFTTETNIAFELKNAANVSITITDITGKQVDALPAAMMSEGAHNIIYNGSELSTGMYFVTIKTGDNTFTQKISIIK